MDNEENKVLDVKISHGKTDVEAPEFLSDPSDSIEYGAGTGEAMMAELANDEIPVIEQGMAADPVTTESGATGPQPGEPAEEVSTNVEDGVGSPGTATEEVKTDDEPEPISIRNERTDPMPTEPKKPEFNVNEVQDPRVTTEKEGGVTSSRKGMSMKSNGNPATDGGQLKPMPNMERDSLVGKYEVTGFRVTYSVGKDSHSVEIRDYFNDLETAKMSVNNTKYLMPMPKGGFKVSEITLGAPIICLNERQLLIYRDGKWVRS